MTVIAPEVRLRVISSASLCGSVVAGKDKSLGRKSSAFLSTWVSEHTAYERRDRRASAVHSRSVWETRAIDGVSTKTVPPFDKVETGQGLSRATRHNQLASVGSLKSFQYVDNGPFLMRTGDLRLPYTEVIGMSPRELAPVNGAPVQVIEGQGMGTHPLAFHGFFGMFAEGGGSHNHALREWAFTGFGTE